MIESTPIQSPVELALPFKLELAHRLDAIEAAALTKVALCTGEFESLPSN